MSEPVPVVLASPRDAGRRQRGVRRARLLAWFTIAWNSVEGLVGVGSGVAAASIALIGFGVDSCVEVLSGAVVLWRLAKERHGQELSEAAEHKALRVIAASFFALAAGITVESVRKLVTGEHPSASALGVALTVVSLITMPLLARSKAKVGRQLGSHVLQADAAQSVLCVWLSAVVLLGLVLNAALGWWWADPVAALGIVHVAVREGRDAWKGDTCC
ncbi:MAG: cation transporter [Actinomycetota bacterium]|nr:cation transporter [Actinomycetota bacterium]